MTASARTSRPAARALDADTSLTTLANGLKLLVLHDAQRPLVHLSIYLRAGSAQEDPKWPGLAHVAEHMVFKGTRRWDAATLNQVAEVRGADVNAHTDKDHTAYHVRGLPEDLPLFVTMLSELVLRPTFPADELERERQVLLQEFAEVDDDPVAAAYVQMDKAMWGDHALARPVIGLERTLERFDRDALVAHVASLYRAPDAVVACHGPVDAGTLAALVEAAFADMPRAPAHALAAPSVHGGCRSRAQAGSSQTHAVLGWPTPGLADADDATSLACAVLGEGMSSPLLAELRERRGLAYQINASADLLDGAGQFVVDASMSPEHALQAAESIATLMVEHAAQAPSAASFERGRRQWLVRQVSQRDKPGRRLEVAAVQTLVTGAPRRWDAQRDAVMAIDAEAVRAAFERLLAQPLSIGISGRVPKGLKAEIAAAVQRRGVSLPSP